MEHSLMFDLRRELLKLLRLLSEEYRPLYFVATCLKSILMAIDSYLVGQITIYID